MDAITLLREHLNPETLLEHYDFSQVRVEGSMIRSCCKLHDGDNPSAFVMNQETGLWYCHTGSCGGGDVFTLVQKMEGLTFAQSVQWVADFYGINIEELEIQERNDQYIEELKAFIHIMRSRKKQKAVEYEITVPVRQVTKFRSFKEETLEYFKLGYVEEITLLSRKGTDYTVRKRLVFPIFLEGVQIGASFRRTTPTDTPKWSHQPVGLETKNILYNYDNAIGESEVIVVEGQPDVWAYHEIGKTAVATFGAHMTEEQYKMLMRTGADITLSYDGDDAGLLATEKVRKMFRNKAIVRHVQFEPSEDPESIPREELLKRYESAPRIE